MKRALKGIIAIFTVLTVGICSLTFSVSADAEILNLKVDSDNVIKKVGLEMYGFGAEWGVGSATALATNFPHRGINTKLVNELKEEKLSFGFYRQAGVSSSAFRWKDSAGHLADRKSSIGASALYDIGITPFGIPEHVKIAQAFEGENAMINFTISMLENNPQEFADLAEYYYGDGIKNYNGGINWAQMRINDGIKDPVNIFAWELGNEYDAGKIVNMFVNSDIYVKQCKEHIAAIKSINPDAKIGVCLPMVATSLENRESYWSYNALLSLEPYIDYAIIHGYVSIDNAFKKDKAMIVLADELQRISNGRIKIIITEYNTQGTLNEKEGTDATAWGYGSGMYFSGARTLTDALCRYVKQPEIIATNFYSANAGTSYACCYLDSDNRYKLTASGLVLSMFQTYGIGDVIDFTLDGFELTKKSKCSACVVKDKDGYVNVILVNNSDTDDYYINFDFGKELSLCEIQNVSADKIHAHNYIDIHEIDRTTTTFDTPEKIEGYKVDKFSIVALKLKEAE